MPVRKRRTKGTKKCLSEWGFTKMPFNDKTVPWALWAGSSSKRDFLEFALEDASENHEVIVYVIAGDYGSGKSYHMRYLHHYVNETLEGLGISFDFPERVKDRGFQDILEGLVTALGYDTIRNVGKFILKRENIKAREEFLAFLEGIGIDRDLRFILANLVVSKQHGKMFNDSWSWLTARASYHETRSLSLLSNPREEPTAFRVISSLIDFLSERDDIIAIFIDELEHLQGRSKAARSSREGLRSLYDVLVKSNPKAGIGIFFAATAIVWSDLTQTLKGALRDRIDQEILLKPLTKEQASGFLKDLFILAGKEEEKWFIPPFKDLASFEKFIKVTKSGRKRVVSRDLGVAGSPRRIIKEGRNLLKWACHRNLDAISSQDVTDIIVLGGED